ncbi:SOS-response transcriptional repressor, LexA [Apilactobacillus ozensis DSM 23829 = JCM 17196]|uniref:LexA repressor n=1 Tax=Apilactobacillus ozensis DSM 23829 = JCM 17196 TaxID=1423781 RepID=A0A0R2APV3_9LACO|nr:transcriptional repressor LexA [Apilactobacillus ozensis]KRM67796.1 SOS-response transcriptional repressor, LexA [Apilactobacillus ozensis DSM 23829 = JCM 17196]
MKIDNTKNSKQFDILMFIWKKINEQGYPPTVREIGDAVSLSSTSTVHGHLTRLEKKELIKRNSAKPRAIEITPKGIEILGVNKNVNKIPIVGTVAAGNPILAIQDTNDYFPLPNNFYQSSDQLFMLNIQGDSMTKIGIFDGDQVIIRRQATAENGDIVIAMNDNNEATCKRFFKESDHYRLQPENDDMAPIILKKVTILGIVVGLYRSHIN